MTNYEKVGIVAIVILLALSIFGCASQTVTAKIPLPERPAVPTIAAESLMCLSDEAYENLARRDKLLTNHIQTLEEIIRSTH